MLEFALDNWLRIALINSALLLLVYLAALVITHVVRYRELLVREKRLLQTLPPPTPDQFVSYGPRPVHPYL